MFFRGAGLHLLFWPLFDLLICLDILLLEGKRCPSRSDSLWTRAWTTLGGMVVFGTAGGRSQRRARHLMAHGLDLAGSDGGFRRGGREISWPMARTMLGGMVVFGAAGARSHGPWLGPCWERWWFSARRARDLMAHGLGPAGRDDGFRRGGRKILWSMAWTVLGGMVVFGTASARAHGPWLGPCWDGWWFSARRARDPMAHGLGRARGMVVFGAAGARSHGRGALDSCRWLQIAPDSSRQLQIAPDMSR